MRLLSVFLLTACSVGLQPTGKNVEAEENEPDDSPSNEPSVIDVDTSEPDSGVTEPDDTDDEDLITGLISSIEPAYGSTLGNTELTIIGGPFTGNTTVTIGGYETPIISNTGSRIRVLTPSSNAEAAAEVRVDLDEGFALAPEPFYYFDEGAGLAGAVGFIEMTELIGGYWTDSNGNQITDGAKEGSVFIGFNQATDFHWWQFYTSSMDTCSLAGIDANGDGVYDTTSPPHYEYSGSLILSDIGASTITLAGQSIQALSRGSSDLNDINYYFYQDNGIAETDILDNSFFSLEIDEGPLVGLNIPQFARASKQAIPSSPNMSGVNPVTIASNQTFTWTSSGADWIQIQMFHRNISNLIDSNIICVVEDDGLFTIPNGLHQNWVSGEAVYVQFSRVFESNTTLPHNNSEARVIGSYTVTGAGFMN